MLKGKRGFTLIELLVVIAIIAILAAILFPVFSRAREQARKTACLSNMKQIGMALAMYTQDWDETLPFWWFRCWGGPNVGGLYWHEQLMPYVKNLDVFRCPSASVEWQAPCGCYPGTVGRPQNNIRCNYGYHDNMLAGSDGINRLARQASPAETVVIADAFDNWMTPYAPMSAGGIIAKVAFANIPDKFNTPGFSCGCPPTISLPLDVALDKWARHSGGAVLVFADGHAKWYKGDQIKSRCRGGTLRISCPDIRQ